MSRRVSQWIKIEWNALENYTDEMARDWLNRYNLEMLLRKELPKIDLRVTDVKTEGSP